jgi:hypothetical protein
VEKLILAPARKGTIASIRAEYPCAGVEVNAEGWKNVQCIYVSLFEYRANRHIKKANTAFEN